MEINKIYSGDCLEEIKKIPDKSIDAIITDPPYFLGMTHNGKKGEMTDLAICTPFYDMLFKEIKRVLKDDGSVYMFTDWRGYAFYYPIFDRNIGARNMLVWDKGSGGGNYYTFEHELIIFGTNNTHFACKGARNILRGIKAFASGAKATNGEKVHPTQKPIELIERLICDSTKEGDLVLDCFMGSGTTAIAAKKLNRNFIGFEIQEKYVEIAQQRLKQVHKQTELQH